MVLVLSEADVSAVIDQKTAVDQMELAFRELSAGRTITPHRFTVQIPQSFGTFRLMPSVMTMSDPEERKSTSGFKLLSGTAGHRQDGRLYFLVALLDYEDGSVKCLMGANRLTQIRTGAASALATKYLARKNCKSFGLIGAGVQGRGQLEAICMTMKPSTVLVYDRSREKAGELADITRKMLGVVDARAVDSLDEAAGADIVSTATTSATPILNADNVKPGSHINAIGSNMPSKKELDIVELLTKNRTTLKIVVDLKEQAVQESGDLESFRRGELPASAIYAELGQIVSGLKPGRSSDDEITIYKSVGIALQDIAMAQLVYERATAKGIGVDVRF